MTDKVVIRLINPRPQDRDEDFAPAPVVVYYWHRIVAAVVVGLLLLMGLVAGGRALLRNGGEELARPAAVTEAPRLSATAPPAVARTAAPPARPLVTDAPVVNASPRKAVETHPVDKAAAHASSAAQSSRVHIQSRNIRRAQLTSNVVNGEPVDEVARVIPMTEKGLVKVYLHTETSGLKGRLLFHDWYWKDRLIAHARVPVRQDRQVLTTSKFIDRIMTGPWQVKIVDEHKKVYAQGNFEVQ